MLNILAVGAGGFLGAAFLYVVLSVLVGVAVIFAVEYLGTK